MPYYDYYNEFYDLIKNQELIIEQNNKIIDNQYLLISGDQLFYDEQKEYNLGFTYGLVILSVWCTIQFLILCGNLVTCLIKRGGIFHA